MSRHQNLRNLDYDDELDDFDGGEDYEYDGVAGGSPGEFVPSLCTLLEHLLI